MKKLYLLLLVLCTQATAYETIIIIDGSRAYMGTLECIEGYAQLEPGSRYLDLSKVACLTQVTKDALLAKAKVAHEDYFSRRPHLKKSHNSGELQEYLLQEQDFSAPSHILTATTPSYAASVAAASRPLPTRSTTGPALEVLPVPVVRPAWSHGLGNNSVGPTHRASTHAPAKPPRSGGTRAIRKEERRRAAQIAEQEAALAALSNALNAFSFNDDQNDDDDDLKTTRL